MQKKNTIKNTIFFVLSVLLGEGVFGVGLFWPYLLSVDIGIYAYWVGLLVGIFFSVYYSLGLGLVSLFLLCVIFIWQTFFVSSGLKPFWLIFVSVVSNVVFDLVFGFGFSVVDNLLVLIVSFLLARKLENNQTIKVSL